MSLRGLSDEHAMRLLDELNILEAAAFIAGVSSTKICPDHQEGGYYLQTDNKDPQNAYLVFHNAWTALKRAVKSGKIKAKIVVLNQNPNLVKEDLKIDWIAIKDISDSETTIERQDLVDWLSSRGCYPSFFFPQGSPLNYMDKDHPNYSPKLAACVGAWLAAQDDSFTGTVKQFMTDWLKQNANQYGVQNDAETTKAFEQMAAIANFSTKGGRVSSKLTPLSDTDYSQDSDLIKKRTFDSVLVAELPTREELQSLTDAEDDLPF